MIDKFYINKNVAIIIYGAASIGILAYQELNKNYYNIIGFIDQRHYEIKQRFSKPVWGIKEVPDYIDKQNVIIIVGVKNVFDHDDIVFNLTQCGYQNILFKPSSVIAGCADNNAKSIGLAYDNLLNGQTWELPVAKTFELQKQNLVDNCLKIDEGDYKVCLIPIEQIFTDFYEDGSTPFEDVPIFALYPHIDLFRFLGGNIEASYTNYLDFCCNAAATVGQIEITDGWKQYTLRNRSIIYEQMSISLELDFNFFIRNAPNAVYNIKGYFNLKSGKHRAAFFVSRNFKYMPLKINTDDYNKYINIKSLQNLISYIEENRIYKSKAPIPHPYFFKFVCNNIEFYRTYIYRITDFLSKEFDFKTLSILDRNDDDGYTARYLSKTGCKVTRASCEVFESLLNDVFYADSMLYETNYEVQRYDICLCCEQDICKITARYIIAIVPESFKDGDKLFNGYLNDKLVQVVLIKNEQGEVKI